MVDVISGVGMARFFGLLLSIVVGVVACGDKDDDKGGSISRCQFEQEKSGKKLSSCTEYSRLNADQASQVKTMCLIETGGSWEDGSPCSQANVQGRCRFQAKDITFTYYYYPEFDQESAEANCLSASGQWQG